MECDDGRGWKLLEYQAALEEERRKIVVFQRELPLSLELVTQAIERINQQMRCAGETALLSEGPVLEEFIPLKPGSSSSAEEGEEEEEEENGRCFVEEEEKPDWLRSVHLWSQSPEQISGERLVTKPIPVDVRKFGSAFYPMEGEKHMEAAAVAPTAVEPVRPLVAANSKCGAYEKEEGEKEGSSTHQRKTRRCWSPELHRRFLHALEQLGGSHAATPKQIRELMKVDGLTNDEVKSHLQKFRLHNRRSAPAVQSSNSSSPQTQFVLVGGIWVQAAEYAAAASAAASAVVTQSSDAPITPKGPPSSAPIASSLPQEEARPPKKKKQTQRSSLAGPLPSEKGNRDSNGSHREDDEVTNSTSPSVSMVSSSSQATAVSPLERRPS